MKTQLVLAQSAAVAVLALACGAVSAQTSNPTGSTTAAPMPQSGASAGASGSATEQRSANPAGSTASAPPSQTGPASDEAVPRRTSRATSGNAMVRGQYSQKDTQDFISQAAYANRAEIAEARYVMDHTNSQAVKDFAKKMISDHSMALDQLQQIASSGGYTMPSGIDKKDRSSMDKLKKDQGARMNMAYSSHQERDHKEVIAKFQQAEQNQNIAPAVREYARTILPKLEEHLRMAQQLVASESKGNRKAG